MGVTSRPQVRPTRTLSAAGFALGFALGGFFDGILLHQILQWHHLLSGLETVAANIRLQVLADGLFHLLMYLIGGIGLFLSWRSRGTFATLNQDRVLIAAVLLGFGVWHVVDAVASHWLLGIHRIKMDAETPLVWDVGWLLIFGIIPVAAGWLISSGRIRFQIGRETPVAIAAMTMLGAAGAALPPPVSGEPTVIVVFLPGTSPAQAVAAIRSVHGRFLWSDSSDSVWAVNVPPGASIGALYSKGAMLVSRSALPLGCLDWVRT